MKSRTIPFGYKCENGSIRYEQSEMQTLIRMTDMYLDGMSLKAISDTFNRENIEYAHGVIGWNKSRIMRLLSDERYTGNGVYPAIISIETYEHIQAKKENNSRLADTDLHSDIYRLNVPIICPACKKAMKRKVKDNKKNRICWCCSNCGYKLHVSDEDLLAGIEKQLMRFVDQPDMVRAEDSSEIIESKEISELKWNIEWALERPDLKIELALENIRKLAALRYKAISEQYYTALRLKADFLKSYQLYDYSREKWRASMIDLANRTIREIHISDSGRVSIVLMNGQSSPEGA